MEVDTWLQEHGFGHLSGLIQEEGAEDVEDLLILFDEEALVGRCAGLLGVTRHAVYTKRFGSSGER